MRKRITIVIETSEELRNELKIRAIKRNITMKKWILMAIAEQIKKEQSYE